MSKQTILIIGGALGLATILYARKLGGKVFADTILPGLLVFGVVSGFLARTRRINEEKASASGRMSRV